MKAVNGGLVGRGSSSRGGKFLSAAWLVSETVAQALRHAQRVKSLSPPPRPKSLSPRPP